MNQRKVLLIEPNYSNKYPPIGLMKLASYFRNRGDEVVFYKGDLRQFVIERIALKCIDECKNLSPEIDWSACYPTIYEYIKTRRKNVLERIDLSISPINLLLEGKIIDAKDYYWKGEWKKHPEWDFVGVTTLFTFYWDVTIETINFAKQFVKPGGRIMVGGVLASIQPKEIEQATGIKPYVGVLNKGGEIDGDDNQIIDELPLDYSILEEVDYEYPMSNAYYGYTSRGCIRKCSFCAVSTLEPQFIPYIPLEDRIDGIKNKFGEQKDLLLMDNNILASPYLDQIINEIIACGFGKGMKFIQPNIFDKSFENLIKGINDRAYKRKCFKEIVNLYNRLKDKSEDAFTVYHAMDDFNIKDITTVTKESLLGIYPILKPIYQKHFKPQPKQRYVDFNQGVDARLFNEKNVKLLSSIAIRPLRIAFDDLRSREAYENAVRLAVNAGIKDFSNYLLYNYKDTPGDLYVRLRINVDLCDELGVSIYSFPMKYHPLHGDKRDNVDYSHNRDYIGEHWNRKYIRAIQAILNSTKGKVGKGTSFFEEAFGKNLTEFKELLEMPETFILYRFFYKWLDDRISFGPEHWRICWRRCMSELDSVTIEQILEIVHSNCFDDERVNNFTTPIIKELFGYYSSNRGDILDPDSELYQLKQEYDSHPTIKLKRKHK
ncbi:MAG: hypothetical protein NC453_14595 [Muribaculum sp.]|nr:hypothetical protein [Muribaculum sp.]